jgi:uncharacterized membrane protein YphA (DoxX/SURF4 family)
MVAIVFLSEGILKFLYPSELGAGRFAKIGIPWPDVMGPFVGVLEIVCGVLVLTGLLTRIAAAFLLADISVALVSTKLPILLGHPFGPFSLAKLQRYGLAAAIHEARTDLCMWLACLFLILSGAGAYRLGRRVVSG